MKKVDYNSQNFALLLEYEKSPTVENRNQIVKFNQGLVEKIARKYANSCKLEFTDCVQLGNIGLIKAVENFDCKKSAVFYSFAGKYIQGSMSHYLRDKSNLIKISRNWLKLNAKIKTFAKKRFVETGYYPTDTQIAMKLEIDLSQINQCASAISSLSPKSLDVKLHDISSDWGMFTLQDAIADPATPLHLKSDCISYSFTDKKIDIDLALNKLSVTERKIILLYYFESWKYSQIASYFGTTCKTVKRRMNKALNNLRLQLA